jgi:hypothetical protein
MTARRRRRYARKLLIVVAIGVIGVVVERIVRDWATWLLPPAPPPVKTIIKPVPVPAFPEAVPKKGIDESRKTK